MRLGEEPYPSVHIPLAAKEQKEGECQYGRERGDEPGGANGYSSGGREEVPEQRSQFVPETFELVAEPLEESTETVLLGEPLDVFGRPLRGVSRGGDEFGQPIYLVDQHGQEDPNHEDQRYQQPQVGERYGDGALDQAVAPLQPVYGRVENRSQEQGDNEPADEGPDLPQEKQRSQHHHHSEQGCGD